MRAARAARALGAITALAGVLEATGCGSHATAEYAISPDVTSENRALLIERFEKGKVLFRANCAICHGVYGHSRDSVPDFTQQQIDDYNANFVKADQTNHAVARRMSQQQVDYILTFLRLRIRTATPATTP